MPLSDTAIKNAKPRDKQYKLFDADGLFLIIAQNGGKWWRFKYRIEGKEKLLSLGTYPETSLKEARAKRDEVRTLIAKGEDPSLLRKMDKTLAKEQLAIDEMTFEKVAREWFGKKTTNFTDGHRKKILSRLENQLFPFIGKVPFASLKPKDILEALRNAESRGAIETAHRLAQLAGQISRFAVVSGYIEMDIASRLSETLPAVKTAHYATITTPEEIRHLLLAVDHYPDKSSISFALKIIPYVFVRSGELRAAQWTEINFEKAEWVIPEGRMKMRRPHVVPLATQVIKILNDIGRLYGTNGYIFQSTHSASRCISDMGLLNALRRLGYAKGEMTIHGFRSMASTLLNEQGYRPDVIEAQLSHCERNAIRAAYNHAEYLPERRIMMQQWADYLDSLKNEKQE